jgi:hypothetical protein
MCVLHMLLDVRNAVLNVSTRVVLLGAAVLAVCSSRAAACRGPQFHRSILLDEVPPKAETSPVVARVVVTAIEAGRRRHPPQTVGLGRVLSAIKGVQVGQVVEIEATETSCGGGLDTGDIGKEGFIAGRIDASGLFVGSWSNLDRSLLP